MCIALPVLGLVVLEFTNSIYGLCGTYCQYTTTKLLKIGTAIILGTLWMTRRWDKQHLFNKTIRKLREITSFHGWYSVYFNSIVDSIHFLILIANKIYYRTSLLSDDAAV
jgi:hypothetical protein